MKNILPTFILIVIILFNESCSKKKEEIRPIIPTANFIYTINKDGNVQFTNKSQLASKYLWDFGDGSNSTEKDPIHFYSKPNDYKISLTVESTDGNKDIKNETIKIANNVEAKFSFENTSFNTPCIINFKNESNVDSFFEWDFGDGYTSTEKNPNHIYILGGTYTISLKIKNSDSQILGQYQKQIVVKDILLPKINKTTIITRVKKDINNTIKWSDTTVIVSNDLNKISFVRLGNKAFPRLLLFEYANNETKCYDYSVYNSSLYTFKFNNLGYISNLKNSYKGLIYNYDYIYDNNNFLVQITDDNTQRIGSGTKFEVIDQNLKRSLHLFDCCTGNGYDFETDVLKNSLSSEILLYILNGTKDDIGFYESSFIYFFNAKTYTNLIKSKSFLGGKVGFTYFMGTNNNIYKVLATNVSEKYTIETNISYQ